MTAAKSKPAIVAKVEITGLKETVRKLERFDRELVAEVKQAERDALAPVLVAAQARVPRRSGRLAKSMRVGALKGSAYVQAGGSLVPYAGPIHFGWRAHNITAQPFLFEALTETEPEVVHVFEHLIDALVTRAGE